MRRQRSVANHSVEAIFATMRSALAGTLPITTVTAVEESRGVLPRLAILRQAASLDADVVHITGDITFAALGVPRRRAIVTILDCIHETWPRSLRRSLVEACWLRWPVRHVARVTAISSFTRDRVAALAGIDATAIRVIAPCLLPGFGPAPAPGRRERPRLLQVGATPNKNLERLAEALAGLPVELRVVGRLGASQRAAMARHGIACEELVGLDGAAVRAAYADADVVTFASTYEGFGMPIIEGQATGRPVVTGNVTAMPETAGDAACLVDPFDPASIRAGIARVLEDAAYREALVARGFANVERFRPARLAEQYRQLYLDVAAGAG